MILRIRIYQYLEYLLIKKEFLENAIRGYEKFDDSSIYAGYNESRRKLIMPYYISDKEYVRVDRTVTDD